jgi:PST family polysaccharide transporter
MNFFKTSVWASISTAVTTLCGLITTKYVAAVVGPSGMAYIGQFGNSTQQIQLLASAACSVGVVKYISENEDIEYRKKILSNALLLVMVCTFVASILTVVFAGKLSLIAFHQLKYYNLFVSFAVLVIFSVLNGIFASVLNGMQQIKLLALLNIGNSALNVAFILVGFYLFGIEGVLMATFAAAFFMSFFYIYVLVKKKVFPSVREIFKPSKYVLKLLLGFSAMSIVSGLIQPNIQIFIRSLLMLESTANAGNWQACTRISDYYLNFIYAVLGMYYLPKLSSLKETHEVRSEIWKGMARVLPVVALMSLSIWLCRELLIRYLLTEEFRPMLPLLKWQLAFDVIKIASWLLAYLMWAKAMKRTLIVTEIVFAITNIFFSWFFIHHFGMQGSIYAFGANYTLYLVTLMVLFRKTLFR